MRGGVPSKKGGVRNNAPKAVVVKGHHGGV
jgi:hypothetical protein